MLLLFVQSCKADDNCRNPETQSAMNICSGIKLDKIEKELEAKVNGINKHLKIIDGSTVFNKANEAWIIFRNLHCESISKIYESGSIHSLIESECKIMMTKERIYSLDSDYKDTIDTILNGDSGANK